MIYELKGDIKMSKKYNVHLTTKDVIKILAEYFECKVENVSLIPYENDRECGVNVYIETTKKPKTDQFKYI